MKGHRKSEWPDIQERNRRIAKLFKESRCSAKDLGRRFGLAEKTINYIVAKEKKEALNEE